MRCLLLLLLGFATSQGQLLESMEVTARKGLGVRSYSSAKQGSVRLKPVLPLFTVSIDDQTYSSLSASTRSEPDSARFRFKCGVTGSFLIEEDFSKGWKAVATFRNPTEKDVKIADVVPFGQSPKHVYITASGPWALARTKIFFPDKGPIGVILPDNAWEMGYGDPLVGRDHSICAIARRTASTEAKYGRWQTTLAPGGTVEYTFYADAYEGTWQEGLRLMFQDRFLFDVDEFDNSLHEREDLGWIRRQYTMVLQTGWDHQFYDTEENKYHFNDLLDEGERLFGGWDVFALWPNFPRLGLDQRNQWDLHCDLPGGLAELGRQVKEAHNRGAKYLISYNPWDVDTRKEDHIEGMIRILKAIDADGVVLDTRGASDQKLRDAADAIRPGIVMYSEGMAVPKDMQGIVSGRVHNAIVKPPPLNLNKFIKPDFAIFRVDELKGNSLHRDFSISLFNGIGTEMNIFHPGRPDWKEQEYLYLGRTTRILRENSSAFLSHDWTPLIPSLVDSVWINRWPDGDKIIYTILSLTPGGYHGPVMKAESGLEGHYVDIWWHEEITLDTLDGELYVPAQLRAFDKAWSDTDREGNVDAIALLPEILRVQQQVDSLYIDASAGDQIIIWAGNPSYQGKSKSFRQSSLNLNLRNIFGRYEGKFVVQLFQKGELLDERVVTVPHGTARLVSTLVRTERAGKASKDMVEIKGGAYTFTQESDWYFVPYPPYSEPVEMTMRRFFMDKYPVTNKQFKQFLGATGYRPSDHTSFLRHWNGKNYPQGQGDHPVVWVSLEDARAYAGWAGKRLPTETEWQYAAQGNDGRKWPWGNDFDSTRCNVGIDHTTPVSAYPNGASPFGVEDMVGNVWQLTNDHYDNGSHYYTIMRGGSYFHPASSRWYLTGGPQQLDNRQILLRAGPGFDRSSTVGFRCVKDAK